MQRSQSQLVKMEQKGDDEGWSDLDTEHDNSAPYENDKSDSDEELDELLESLVDYVEDFGPKSRTSFNNYDTLIMIIMI